MTEIIQLRIIQILLPRTQAKMEKIKKISISIISIIIILISIVNESYAQSKADSTYFNKLGISFHAPDGFKFYVGDLDFQYKFIYDCNPDGAFNPGVNPKYYYANHDQSVIIGINIIPITPGRGDNIFTAYYIDDNIGIFKIPKLYADTINNVLSFYPAQALEETRVDRIVTYSYRFKLMNSDYIAKMTKEYLKHDKFHAIITYMAKPHVMNMDEIINSTENILTYSSKQELIPNLNYVQRYYVNIDDSIKERHLKNAWRKGLVYSDLWYFNAEKYAFQLDSAIVSLQFVTNEWWPYHNVAAKNLKLFEAKPETWNKGNLDFLRYLKPSDGKYEKLSDSLLVKLNADEAYSFDFSHAENDLYRGVYRDCKVFLVHKKNVGSYLIKYYYKEEEKERLDEIIKNSWGKIAFQDGSYFESLGVNIIPF